MREKQIKGWLRSKKVTLIESMNPQWKDLSVEWLDCHSGLNCHSEGAERPKNPFPFEKGTDPSLRSG